MTTLAELESRILRILGDPEGTATSQELLLDAIASAYNAILPWFPKTASASLAAGITLSTLPADLYAIESVVDTVSGDVFPRTMFRPGILVGADSREANTWHEIPSASVSFARQLTNAATLNYLAHWSTPTMDDQKDELIEIPEKAVFGVVLFAASVVLIPQSLDASGLRQYNTRVDSGNPEHNPIQESIVFLQNMFKQEMARHAAYQRAQQ